MHEVPNQLGPYDHFGVGAPARTLPGRTITADRLALVVKRGGPIAPVARSMARVRSRWRPSNDARAGRA